MKRVGLSVNREPIVMSEKQGGGRLYWIEGDVGDFEWDTTQVSIETLKTILRIEQQQIVADHMVSK